MSGSFPLGAVGACTRTYEKAFMMGYSKNAGQTKIILICLDKFFDI